jgi:hypothetical protein
VEKWLVYQEIHRLKRQVLQCKNVKDIETVFEGMFKWGITSFCEFYGINVNSRDTEQSLIRRLLITLI